jgi:ATP-dependent Clp protease ATP-binding subunit ClpC
MGLNISNEVKGIMNESVNTAKFYGDNFTRPEHIVLSILNKGSNLCVDIFKANKIDLIKLQDAISNSLNTLVYPKIVEKAKPPFSNDLKAVLKNVDNECTGLGGVEVDITHIMLSILSKGGPVRNILSNFGINYNNFKDKIGEKSMVTNSRIDEGVEDGVDETDKSKKTTKKIDKNKTVALDNFCRDISKLAEKGDFDPVIGRDKEIKRVAQILSRRKKNNPILIGEAGVGKTAIVEGLALMIHNGSAPRTLINKRIYALEMTSIVAGTKYRGQFEERMKAIIEECKLNPDIILFIDEIQTIIGAGNSSGALDASNIFKPALARGELQAIGATTLDEYREHIEKDGALTRRFQQVMVNEPTLEETKIILNNIKGKYEKHHKVKYTDDAIDECVKLAHRYIMDRAMPDKAIDVLDEAGAAANVSIDKPQEIKTLENKKREIILKKKAVVSKQQYEEAALLRDEEKKTDDALALANKKWETQLEDRATNVGIEEISEVVSMMTGIPLSKISTQEIKKLMVLDKELIGKVIGQDNAVLQVIKSIKRNRVGIKDKNKPIGTFIFLGPTGVGKTYLTKLLAEHVFGDSDSLVRIDMSEYMEKHTVSRLVGAPPGYIGYEEGGQLTEKVRRKPHCVVLFDEIEKAHDDVFNILLQLLDEGHLTDGLGRKVNFKNTLIIMTSNVGSQELSQFGSGIGFRTSASTINQDINNRSIIEKALKKKFKPEFINRVDEFITFNSLKQEDIHKIIYNEIIELAKRIAELGFKLNVNETAYKFLSKEGYSSDYGARPLKRVIQRYVEDPITDKILSEDLNPDDIITVDYDEKTEEINVSVLNKE